jgi:cytidine deaminase
MNSRPTDAQIRDLTDRAKQASGLAYCPYSNFPVGAAMLTFAGEIYTGCNIENCGYTQTIHAEQSAMVKAISAGALKRALQAGLTQLDFISAIAVYAPKGTDPWPCCNCRQSLNEFGLSMWIVGEETADHSLCAKQLKELIPHAFSVEVVLSAVYGEPWDTLKYRLSAESLGVPVEATKGVGISSSNLEAGDDTWQKLVDAAREASQMAYCPYSQYPVGAAVLSFDGSIYTGCNIENCGYTQTIHAEQTALSKAISDGALKRAFEAGLTQFDFVKAIAVYSPKTKEPWPSCVGRQSLNEFGLRMDVIGEGKDGTIVHKKLEELIPYAFPMEAVLTSIRSAVQAERR